MSVFNIRVYGILFNDKKQILISEQFYQGINLRKFPGGGIHYGEGLIDALKREFREELDLEISDISHFYTTDFYVGSIFHADNQVISVYYIVRLADNSISFESIAARIGDNGEIFKWMDMESLSAEDFPLPVEKVVVNLLKEEFAR